MVLNHQEHVYSQSQATSGKFCLHVCGVNCVLSRRKKSVAQPLSEKCCIQPWVCCKLHMSTIRLPDLTEIKMGFT